MNRFEKRKVAIDRAIREQIDEYKAIYARADGEDRDPTEEERLDIESHLKAIETLKEEKGGVEAQIKTLEHVDDIGRELGPPVPSISVKSEPQDRLYDALNQRFPVGNPYGLTSLGEQFTSSAGYKSMVNVYREGGRLPQNFSTGVVELETKGTLSEAMTSAYGAGFVSVPQVVPGVVDKLFQRLTFEDLLLSGQASTTSIRYVVEGTATSGAAGVLEGGTKPESTLGVQTTDENIRKIATILPVSDEMLQDGPAIQSYINGRLTLFVQIESERQLIRGAAGGTEVQGLLTSRSVPVYNGGTAAGTKAEQLFKGMNSMRGSALVEPEWVVLHPSDYEAIRLLKDANNQYYGGGPFFGQYGAGGQATGSNQIAGAEETIWGKPVLVTSSAGSGTAVVGTRANAQVWSRGGISVEASNSHASYFSANLVAIRCERRLGLAVYRSGGYCQVNLA